MTMSLTVSLNPRVPCHCGSIRVFISLALIIESVRSAYLSPQSRGPHGWGL